MRGIAGIFVFTAALVIGTFAASLVATTRTTIVDFTAAPVRHDFDASVKTPLGAEDLLGTWKGTWGRNDGDCTIVIERVERNVFYGTLRKQGAVVLFEGTFNPKTRVVRFDETKVVRLGSHMSEWSLGKNSGFITPDGRSLRGTGHDKWGQYAWAASNF